MNKYFLIHFLDVIFMSCWSKTIKTDKTSTSKICLVSAGLVNVMLLVNVGS